MVAIPDDAEWKEVFLTDLRQNFGNITMTVEKHNYLVSKGETGRLYPTTRQGVYYHINKDKAFKDEITAIQENAQPDQLEYVESKFYQLIGEGSVPCIIFALKNLAPEKYQERQQIGMNINPQEFIQEMLDNIRNDIKKDRAK